MQNSLSQVSQKLTTTPLRGVFSSPSCPDSQDITWEWWESFRSEKSFMAFFIGTTWQRLWVNNCMCQIITSRWKRCLCYSVFVYLYLCICIRLFVFEYFICVFAGEVCLSQPWRLDLHWLIKSSVASSLAKRFSSCAHKEEVVWDLNSSSEPILCELNLWVQIYQKFSKSWMT